ncbi:alpha-(1-_3)-arabinofuranosyltransferase family protein [Chloroflexota bacterium]
MYRIITSGYTHYIFFSLLVAAVLWQLLLPGYILSLDMAYGPQGVAGFENFSPAYPDNALPFRFILNALASFIPMWLLQKAVLFGSLFFCGIGAYRLCPNGLMGKYFAGIFYMFNPLIYTRILSGNLRFVQAYALVPFAVAAYVHCLDTGNYKDFLKATLWTAAIGIFNLQVMALTLLLFIVLFIVKAGRERFKKEQMFVLSRTMLISGTFFLLLSSYWFIPYLMQSETILGAVSYEDLGFFSPKESPGLNVFATLATLQGFWRGGYTYSTELIPALYGLFIIILFLVIIGFVSNIKNGYYVAIGVTSLCLLLLSTGFAGPFQEQYSQFLDKIPIMRGFRDSQKFIAVLALSYSMFGGLGINEVMQSMRIYAIRHKWSAGSIRIKVKYMVALSLIILVLAAPLTYNYGMFGMHGYVKATNYPNEWYRINDYFNRDNEDFNILILPWHLYMDYSWLKNHDKRLINPARVFFDKPVIIADNIELDTIYTQSNNPVSNYIEFLLAYGDDIDNFGELLVPLNVKYILLLKEVDYNSYNYLYEQADLSVVMEGETFTLYQNYYSSTRSYACSSVIHISSLKEYLELSRTQDVREHVYLLGDGIDTTVPTEYTPLEVKSEGVYHFSVSGTEIPWTVFVVDQDAGFLSWRYNGQSSLSNLGFMPVFHSSASGGKVIKNSFYLINVPAYGLSLLVLAVILWLIFLYKKAVRKTPTDQP